MAIVKEMTGRNRAAQLEIVKQMSKNTQILEDIRSSNIHTLRSFFFNVAVTLAKF